MACNCKNKGAEAKKITQERIKAVKPVVDVSLQEINIIENMISDVNSNSEKRAYVSEFFLRNFGHLVINYCDQVCQKTLRTKLQELKKNI